MRKPDKIIIVNKEKIPVFKSPFSEEDYHDIISFRHTYDKFGVLDSANGQFRIYDFEKTHIPDINYLFNTNINFINSVKYMGLAVVGYYAYRIASYKPSLSASNASAKASIKDIQKFSDIFPLADPKIIYKGNGEGFRAEEE